MTVVLVAEVGTVLGTVTPTAHGDTGRLSALASEFRLTALWGGWEVKLVYRVTVMRTVIACNTKIIICDVCG